MVADYPVLFEELALVVGQVAEDRVEVLLNLVEVGRVRTQLLDYWPQLLIVAVQWPVLERVQVQYAQ